MDGSHQLMSGYELIAKEFKIWRSPLVGRIIHTRCIVVLYIYIFKGARTRVQAPYIQIHAEQGQQSELRAAHPYYTILFSTL